MSLPGGQPEARDASEPELSRPRPRRRRGLIVLFSALGVVVLAAVAAFVYLASVAGSYDSKTEKIETAFPQESTRPTATPAANGKTPVNILLVGSDSRGATVDQAESGAASDQRSDTMLLLHVPADRKNAYLISVMRDLWVPIPGHGEAKVNSALAFGGVPLMVQTVESLLEQRIDHVAFIDFEGFKGLTDAVGGVTVNVPKAFTAQQTGGNPRFEAGPQVMDGERALAFVRERYAFADGDYQRVRNQQAYVKGLIGQIAKPETLANPLTISNVVNEFSPYLTVDKSLDSAAVGRLALELKDLRPSMLTSFTVPTGGVGTSADGQSIVLLDQAAMDGLASAMAEGRLPQYVSQAGLLGN